MEDYGKIKKLHDSLQKKEFSCEELTKTYIGAIEADNPALNAYVHFTPETALAAAQEVDAKIARGETLEQACQVHGVDCEELVKKINDHIAGGQN